MRLERVAAHVPAGARLADIGSDHGYLPVALMRRGAISAAVAGEVALTPFRSAERTVRESGQHARISVRLANGLAAIEPEDDITAISLCGMGGETIRDILDSGKARLSGQERLILQPNGGEQPLRLWLMENGYRILCEEVLRENRFYYEIIVAERAGPMVYSAQELYFGPWQMQARSPCSWPNGSECCASSTRPWAISRGRGRPCPRRRCRTSPGRPDGSLSCWLNPSNHATARDSRQDAV